jgi:hypothetical protein
MKIEVTVVPEDRVDVSCLPRERTIEDVIKELAYARAAHPDQNGLRHLHDILREEEDELWDEIRKNPRERDRWRIRQEAAQVAATAIAIMEAVG